MSLAPSPARYLSTPKHNVSGCPHFSGPHCTPSRTAVEIAVLGRPLSAADRTNNWSDTIQLLEDIEDLRLRTHIGCAYTRSPSRPIQDRGCNREKARRRWTVRAVVAVAAVAVVTGTAQAAVYWGNSGTNGDGTTIGRANLNGSKPSQKFITKAAGPVGVAVDRKYLYWSDALNASCGGTTIGRANINGSAPNPSFIKGVSCAHGLAVNGTYIYWANRGPNGTGTSIGRAKLDGSGVNVNFITGATGPWGVAMDSDHISDLDQQGDGVRDRPWGLDRTGQPRRVGRERELHHHRCRRPDRHHGERRAPLLVERVRDVDWTGKPQRNGSERVLHQGDSAGGGPRG